MIEQTADQLRRINRILRASAEEDWTSLSLTRAQLRILFLLRREGPAAVGKLAAQLGVTLPSITTTVDRLVQQGLVVREEDAADRRRVINGLTSEGTTVVDRLQDGRRTRLIAALEQLAPEQLQQLGRGLTDLEAALEEAPQASDLREVEQVV